MVKDVPQGATVVGVPGRIVEDGAVQQAARFAAYAVVQNQDDPYAKAIHVLVEHSKELEQSVASLSAKVERLEQELRQAEAQVEKVEQLRAVK